MNISRLFVIYEADFHTLRANRSHLSSPDVLNPDETVNEADAIFHRTLTRTLARLAFPLCESFN